MNDLLSAMKEKEKERPEKKSIGQYLLEKEEHDAILRQKSITSLV